MPIFFSMISQLYYQIDRDKTHLCKTIILIENPEKKIFWSTLQLKVKDGKDIEFT